jgi:hypothetical protein
MTETITVTSTPTLSPDSEDRLDRVTLRRADETVHTIDRSVSYRVDGFHWQFLTATRERVAAFCQGQPVGGVEAVGVRDGTVRHRGTVTQLAYGPEHVEVFVAPPA